MKRSNPLDSIERYNILENSWKLLDIKLNNANYECACFSPEPDKLVVLGGNNMAREVQ